MKKWLNNFFFAPSSGKPLAALRIVLGLAMLTEAILVLPYLDQLYGQYGFLQADLIEALTGSAIPGLLAKWGISSSLYSILFKCFYGIHILTLIGMTVGYKTRWTTAGAWLTQAALLNSGYLSSYGVDRYFLNLSFFLVWLPIAEAWSLDRWRSKDEPQLRASCTFGLRLIQIFIVMTYFDAGHSKTAGQDWWTGESIWRVLNQPEFRRFDFFWLAQVSWLAKLLSWGTMFIEMFYFIGVSIPYLRRPWVLSIIAMHLGIAASMGLTLFGVTLALVNAAIFLIPLQTRFRYANAV